MVGWVFFRADTLSGAIGFLTAMAGLGRALPTPVAVSWHLTPELLVALAAGIVGSMPLVPLVARWRDASDGGGAQLEPGRRGRRRAVVDPRRLHPADRGAQL